MSNCFVNLVRPLLFILSTTVILAATKRQDGSPVESHINEVPHKSKCYTVQQNVLLDTVFEAIVKTECINNASCEPSNFISDLNLCSELRKRFYDHLFPNAIKTYKEAYIDNTSISYAVLGGKPKESFFYMGYDALHNFTAVEINRFKAELKNSKFSSNEVIKHGGCSEKIFIEDVVFDLKRQDIKFSRSEIIYIFMNKPARLSFNGFDTKSTRKLEFLFASVLKSTQ